MKLLIIDNYDSFTFNLYQLAAGVFDTLPTVVQNDSDWSRIADNPFDAVIISPGPGRPERATDLGISSRVIAEMNVPTLGVCLGHQAICYLAGAHITHAPQPMHGRISRVHHAGSGIFQNVPDPFTAVRYHSLIVQEPLPACLEKTAWTDDGLVMAVAHKTRALWGVQFHPESICTEHGRLLLENFRNLATGKKTGSRRFLRETQAMPPGEAFLHAKPGVNASPLKRLFVRRSEMPISAAALFERLFSKKAYSFWLDSSLVREPDARFSFMGGCEEAEIECIRYWSHSRALEIQHGSTGNSSTADLFTYLKDRLASLDAESPALPFDFQGGLIGYFGYELKVLSGGVAGHRSTHPDSYLMVVTHFLAIDHKANQLYLLYLAEPGAESSASDWFEAIDGEIGSSSDCPVLSPGAGEELRFEPAQSKAEYLEKIDRCLEAIHEGETYEICLTNCFSAATTIDSFEFYKHLRSRNPAPYSAFLRFPEFSVASSSPERFLKVSRAGFAEARPIKGTMRRGNNAREDDLFKQALLRDEKSRSENLMIVDLLRNDLGRVCSVGSVLVPKLMQVETYATVHQLVSTVIGKLNPGQSAVDCLKSAFPGGSMTGAPKLRTMKIIDSLEVQARGIYSGSIGFLAFNGSADLSIVIRTAVFSTGRVSIGAGGAIVALSDPQEEWNEVVLKANALITAFAEMTNPGRHAFSLDDARTDEPSRRVS